MVILLVAGTAAAQQGGGRGAPVPIPQPAPAPDRGSIRIAGRVIAEGAAQPPDHSEVRIETTGGTEIDFAYTDALGAFEFRNVELNPNDAHYIVVQAEGFQRFRELLDYQINPRTGGFLTIVLKAAPSNAAAPADDGLTVVDVSQLLADVPEEARREYERAMEEVDDGRNDEAVKRLEKVVALAPDFYPGFDSLGAAYLSLGEFSKAEEALKRATELVPGAAQPWLNLGTLSYQEGEAFVGESRFQEAAEAYNRAIGFLEESIRRDPRVALAFHHLGAAFHRMGQYERAEESLFEALRLDPELQDARLVLVNVYTRQQRYDDALDQLNTYLSDNPASDRRPALERLRDQIESARDR